MNSAQGRPFNASDSELDVGTTFSYSPDEADSNTGFDDTDLLAKIAVLEKKGARQ
jgi:hypothetical protein